MGLNRLATRSSAHHELMLSPNFPAQPSSSQWEPSTDSEQPQLLVASLVQSLVGLLGLHKPPEGQPWAVEQLPLPSSPGWALLQALVSLLCTLMTGSAAACCQVLPPCALHQAPHSAPLGPCRGWLQALASLQCKDQQPACECLASSARALHAPSTACLHRQGSKQIARPPSML